MKIVKFTLKQHTPIVHFQAKDNGATLRASEVKPKLDRYILEEKGRERLHDKGTLKEFREEGARYFRELDLKEIEKKKKDKEYTPKLCCIPGKNEALNYKLFFRIEENVKYFLPMNNVSEKKKKTIQGDAQNFFGLSSIELLSPSPYFANEDKVRDKRWDKVRLATQIEGDIYGEILCQNEELSKMIESYLQSFFLLHNFGARQTKGFGSFTLFSINWVEKTIDLDVYFGKQNACRSKYAIREVGKVFSCIQNEHKKIKTKCLKEYFGKKTEFDLFKDMQAGKQFNEEDFLFVRPLLGLANKYDFSENQKYKTIKINHFPSKNSEDNLIIERFESPILYKPIKTSTGRYEIYVLLKGIPKEIRGAAFQLLVSVEEPPTIKTPSKLDLKEFISKECTRFLKKL